MTEKLGDGPIQPEVYDLMKALAQGVDGILNGDKKGKERPWGFVMMVYPFAEFDKGDARCNYISNGADRRDVVVLMKEMIARFEGQPEMRGKA